VVVVGNVIIIKNVNNIKNNNSNNIMKELICINILKDQLLHYRTNSTSIFSTQYYFIWCSQTTSKNIQPLYKVKAEHLGGKEDETC